MKIIKMISGGLILAGLSALVIGNAFAEEKLKVGDKMPELQNISDKCKKYRNFGNPQGVKLGVLVEIDLNCNKSSADIYKNGSMSVGYLICNILGTAEKIPFGIYIEETDTLYVDKDRDGNVDYIMEKIGNRKIYEDAPSCSLSKL